MSDLKIKAEMAAYSIPVPELHGMVCGMAVNGTGEFVIPNLVDLAGADAISDEASLGVFVSAALDELFDQEMGFSPLIPDDDEPLAYRVMAVADWSGGFLAGFAVAVDDEMSELPDDVREIIKDFVSLSSLSAEDYDELEDGDSDEQENEASLIEIYEYMRVSTLLVMALMEERVDQVASE